MTAAADMPEWVREGLYVLPEEQCLRCGSPSALPCRLHLRTSDGSFDCHDDPATARRRYGPGYGIHDMVAAERMASAAFESTLQIDVLDAELVEEDPDGVHTVSFELHAAAEQSTHMLRIFGGDL